MINHDFDHYWFRSILRKAFQVIILIISLYWSNSINIVSVMICKILTWRNIDQHWSAEILSILHQYWSKQLILKSIVDQYCINIASILSQYWSAEILSILHQYWWKQFIEINSWSILYQYCINIESILIYRNYIDIAWSIDP